MKVQIVKDIDTKELAYSMFTYLVNYLDNDYDIKEENIGKDSLNLLIDEIYKEMKKEKEE